jgi:uracil-DNA glycosylase
MGKARCTIVECGFNCKKDNANSHKHLKWNLFTDAVIEQIANEKEGVVLCCGALLHKKREIK